MSEEKNQMEDSPLIWFEIWQKALLQPSRETYRQILERGNPTLGKAFLWMAAAAVASVFFSTLSQNIYQNWVERLMDVDLALPAFTRGVSALLCGVPAGTVSLLVGFAIWMGLLLLFARLLGGRANYTEMAFAIAAFQAPLTIISGVLSIIPLVNCLTVLAGLYGLFLAVLAIQAVSGVSAGKAVLILLLPLILIGVILGCLILGILAFLVPIRQEISVFTLLA